MRAIILAGGKGTRLQPYTSVLPKPLLPVGGRPIISVVLKQLKKAGVSRATLAVGHMADLFPSVLSNGVAPSLKIDYVRERKPLGTAAPLRNIRGLRDTFLVLNGDILTDLNYRDLVRWHRKRKAVANIATFKRSVAVDFGVVVADSEGAICDYHEKPRLRYSVSMGIYTPLLRPLTKPMKRPADWLHRKGQKTTARVKARWQSLKKKPAKGVRKLKAWFTGEKPARPDKGAAP